MLPSPVTPLRPLPTSSIVPSKSMAYADTDPLPVFVTYAKRPFGLTATQHAGPGGWRDRLQAAILVDVIRGDRARVGCSAKSLRHEELVSFPERKPERRHAGRRVHLRGAGEPVGVLAHVTIVLVFFSVTSSTSPSGVNEICAGPTAVPLRARVDPGSGLSVPRPERPERRAATARRSPECRRPPRLRNPRRQWSCGELGECC
jgi:hypothetical protein